MIEIKTAGKLGYCSGVAKAIEMAIEFGDKHGKVYSLGTVAHNEDVVELLRQHGVEPIGEDQLKGGENVIITAHGAPPKTYEHLGKLQCGLQDCTCPIVEKAQHSVMRLHADGHGIVIFGDPEHQEVKGLVGHAFDQVRYVGGETNLFTPEQARAHLHIGSRLGIVSQTTKSPEDYVDFVSMLLHHQAGVFQQITVVNTICPIVAQRIEATAKLSREVDLMLIVGSKESANTQNLAKAALQGLLPDRRSVIRNAGEDTIPSQVWSLLQERETVRVGITAGTSTPIEVVEKVIARVKELADGS